MKKLLMPFLFALLLAGSAHAQMCQCDANAGTILYYNCNTVTECQACGTNCTGIGPGTLNCPGDCGCPDCPNLNCGCCCGDNLTAPRPPTGSGTTQAKAQPLPTNFSPMRLGAISARGKCEAPERKDAFLILVASGKPFIVPAGRIILVAAK